MNIDAVIQARMGSTRLPGKVLLPLGDGTVLEHVLRRSQRCKRLRQVVVATTTLPEDEAIVRECERLGVTVVRGPVDDVLARYAIAAGKLDGDAVVRITSDCPLVDPVVIDDMLAHYAALCATGTRCDYLANTLVRTFPRGLDVELVRTEVLLQANAEASSPPEREHVTPYVHRHPERFALHGWRASVDASAHRWTLDTPEDYQLLSRIFEALGPTAAESSWLEVLALVNCHPEWSHINQHVEQKAVPG